MHFTLATEQTDRFRTAKFWAMLCASYVIVVSPLFLSVFTEPGALYVWAYLHLALSAVFVWLFLLNFLRYPTRLVHLFWPPRGTVQPMPEAVKLLADQAQVTIRKYIVVPGWLNAQAKPGGILLVGERLFTDLSSQQALAVIAHEMGHHRDFKRGLLLVKFLVLAGLALAFLATIPVLHPWVIVTGWCNALLLGVWITGWIAENSADDWSVKAVGVGPVTEALAAVQGLVPSTGFHSLTHPSMPHRIRRLARRSDGDEPALTGSQPGRPAFRATDRA